MMTDEVKTRSLTPKSVLLIDDDHDIALGVSLRLRALGYQTEIAHDGRDGLRKAHQLHPEAILLDVRLPDLNGLQILDELQRNPQTRDIPIIMLSASLVDCQTALNSGASFFIGKPYDWSQLLAALDHAMEKHLHA
jgi:CheY-like chemotaxis protein